VFSKCVSNFSFPLSVWCTPSATTAVFFEPEKTRCECLEKDFVLLPTIIIIIIIIKQGSLWRYGSEIPSHRRVSYGDDEYLIRKQMSVFWCGCCCNYYYHYLFILVLNYLLVVITFWYNFIVVEYLENEITHCAPDAYLVCFYIIFPMTIRNYNKM